MTVKEHLSPKQVANAIGVSESSLKRWVDRGLIPTVRTVGGHRRLPVSGVLQFLRKRGFEAVQPHALGLPAGTTRAETKLESASDLLRLAMEEGSAQELRRSALGLFMAGHSVLDICDKAIAPAFLAIGDRWSHGEVEIYQERRAVEITMRLLHELGRMLPDVDHKAPTAIGATLSPDIYSIAVTMAELALRETGWRADSLGSGHPPQTLINAMLDRQPRLFWLSVSHIDNPAQFLANYQLLYDVASERGIAMVVGGRALSPEVREQMRYSAFCDNLGHLVALADTVR